MGWCAAQTQNVSVILPGRVRVAVPAGCPEGRVCQVPLLLHRQSHRLPPGPAGRSPVCLVGKGVVAGSQCLGVLCVQVRGAGQANNVRPVAHRQKKVGMGGFSSLLSELEEEFKWVGGVR